MRINCQMTLNPLGLRSSEALCIFIGIDEPLQEIIKSNFKTIHKMIKSGKPRSILDQLQFPTRSCGYIQIKDYPLSEKSKRSPLYSGIKLYNAVPANFKILPHKVVKKNSKSLT